MWKTGRSISGSGGPGDYPGCRPNSLRGVGSGRCRLRSGVAAMAPRFGGAQPTGSRLGVHSQDVALVDHGLAGRWHGPAVRGLDLRRATGGLQPNRAGPHSRTAATLLRLTDALRARVVIELMGDDEFDDAETPALAVAPAMAQKAERDQGASRDADLPAMAVLEGVRRHRRSRRGQPRGAAGPRRASPRPLWLR